MKLFHRIAATVFVLACLGTLFAMLLTDYEMTRRQADVVLLVLTIHIMKKETDG